MLRPGLKKMADQVDLDVEDCSGIAEKFEKQIYCGACGHALTLQAFEMTHAGAHTHVFQNPAGFTFEIGLFKEVPGAGERGTPQAEHSWFAGLLWCYAHCLGCGVHLGWKFIGEEAFWGLIETHLRYD